MLDQTLRLLDQLVDQRMRAAGDVLEVSLGVWAIHGSIPVDGEVILAEFSVLDEARSASCGGGSSAHLVTLGSWSVQTAFLSRGCRDEAGDGAFPPTALGRRIRAPTDPVATAASVVCAVDCLTIGLVGPRWPRC
jgi:hypothetical protein